MYVDAPKTAWCCEIKYVACSGAPQASVAILDRKMAALRSEIAQAAALAAQRHKFSQGSAQPTGDASPTRLASGLAATAQVCCSQLGPVMPQCALPCYRPSPWRSQAALTGICGRSCEELSPLMAPFIQLPYSCNPCRTIM